VEQEARTEAWAWLKARFPEADNPLAYWSLPDEIDFDSFPKDYLFTVEGGFVTATHLPTGVTHGFEVTPGLRNKESPPTLVEGFDASLRVKASAWATLIANQPRDPRPRKAQ
jgi:hypothetical protein